MAVKPIPEGDHTAIPYLTVPDADALLRFVSAAFQAKTSRIIAMGRAASCARTC